MQCFLKCFEGPKRSLKFFQLTKYSRTSLHNHHQNTLKRWFTIIWVFRWNNCGFSRCLNG